jgi:hypothetical protein
LILDWNHGTSTSSGIDDSLVPTGIVETIGDQVPDALLAYVA